MKSSIAAFLLAGPAVALLVAGCAQFPHETFRDAKKSLEEAEKAGAEMYAFSQFKAAQVSFELAKKEIAEENKKIPFLRKFKKITETLNSATRAAKSAHAAVEKAKTRIHMETSAVINQTKTLADTVKALLKKIPAKTAVEFTPELDTLMTAIATAEESLRKDDLLAAKEKAAVTQLKMTCLAKSVEKLAPRKKTGARARKR